MSQDKSPAITAYGFYQSILELTKILGTYADENVEATKEVMAALHAADNALGEAVDIMERKRDMKRQQENA